MQSLIDLNLRAALLATRVRAPHQFLNSATTQRLRGRLLSQKTQSLALFARLILERTPTVTSTEYRSYGRSVRRIRIAVLAAVIALWLGMPNGGVRAAPNPTTQRSTEPGNQTSQRYPDVERAMKFRSLIEQATKDFRTGKFEEAIGGYWSAYQLRSQPLLLFNIAQVHRKVGHTQEALMFYERYLNADPRSDLAAEVRVYVHALRASQQSVAESANAQSVSPQSQGIGGTTSTNELDVFVPQALPSPTDNFLGTEEQRQIAFRQHSEAAAASFRRGDYKTTEAEYWAAYGLKPQTIILFNIAQVYRKEERWNEALTLFRRYLKEEPSSTLAGEVEGRIAEANARIQTQKRDSERLAAERLAKANVLLAERMMELRDIDRKIAAQGSSGNAKPVYRRPWFWGILGVTIVGVGLGVGLGVVMHPPLDPSSDLGLRVVYFR